MRPIRSDLGGANQIGRSLILHEIGSVESADFKHYQCADHKRRGCDEERCFKRGHDPMFTHDAAPLSDEV